MRRGLDASLPFLVVGIGLIGLALWLYDSAAHAAAGRSPLWVLFLLLGITVTAGGTLAYFAEDETEIPLPTVVPEGYRIISEEEWLRLRSPPVRQIAPELSESEEVPIPPVSSSVGAEPLPAGVYVPGASADTNSSPRILALEAALSEIEAGLASLPPIGMLKGPRTSAMYAPPPLSVSSSPAFSEAPQANAPPGGPELSRSPSADAPLESSRPKLSGVAGRFQVQDAITRLHPAVPSQTEYDEALKALGISEEDLQPLPVKNSAGPLNASRCISCGVSVPEANIPGTCSRCGRAMCSPCLDRSHSEGRPEICPVCSILDQLPSGPFRARA